MTPAVTPIRIPLLVAMALLPLAGAPTESQDGPAIDARLRHVANAGVLLSTRDGDVLIDAPIRDGIPPYATSAADERDRLERALAPYDGVDAILVTHWHEDHFSADAVAAHLSRNRRAILISSPEVVERVRQAAPGIPAAQLRSVLPEPGASQLTRVGTLSVRVLRIAHNPTRRLPEQHVGFLVGHSPAVLHTGDANPTRENFALLRNLPAVDVALVPFWFMQTAANRQFVADAIRPRRVVAMHLPPADAEGVRRAFATAAVRALLLIQPGTDVALSDAPPADLPVTGRMHHVRSGANREWSEFPHRAEGSELVLAFDATPNDAEHTLRLRHRDVKQLWRVALNGSEIARLPPDEADTISYLAVPPRTLRQGRNELRIHGSGSASDDVMIGQAALIDRPVAQVLSEATVDVSVTMEPGGRPTPSRITVVDEHGTLVPMGAPSDQAHAVRPGVVYSGTGAVRLKLPAGRYAIHAGRGFEYSVARTDVDLARGSNVSRRLSIRREVDTAGWAAMDTHVHTGTFAKHGDAAIAERMLTIAGEGVELPVSTEHNMLVDFGERAREAGVRHHFTPIVGSEVTTPALGHFNVFPIPAGRQPVDQRAPDWTRLREAIGRVATAPAIVLNHGRDLHGGFRPLGSGRHIGIAGEDLDGWTLPANAMEVVNSGAVMTDAFALPRDWMGLLNRGVILTPVGSSDSHDVTRYIVGQARTYVRCDDRDPGRIDVARAMESFRRGQAMVAYGLLTEIDVAGKRPGELVHPKDELAVRIRVKGPGWTEAQRVALYVNGIEVRQEGIKDGTRAGVKWEGTWRLPAPRHDAHLVAIASGPGVAALYWPTAKPYQPTSIEFTRYVLGVSGAVFVDADGSGRFESAFEYARREVSAAKDARELVNRLAPYDGAVAVQAASLLRIEAPAAFDETVRAALPSAPPHVAGGFTAYLEAWRQSQRALAAAR